MKRILWIIISILVLVILAAGFFFFGGFPASKIGSISFHAENKYIQIGYLDSKGEPVIDTSDRKIINAILSVIPSVSQGDTIICLYPAFQLMDNSESVWSNLFTLYWIQTVTEKKIGEKPDTIACNSLLPVKIREKKLYLRVDSNDLKRPEIQAVPLCTGNFHPSCGL